VVESSRAKYFADSALVTPTRIACINQSGNIANSSPVAMLKTNTSPTYLLPNANGTFTRRCRPSTMGQVSRSEVNRSVVTPAFGSEAQDVLSP